MNKHNSSDLVNKGNLQLYSDLPVPSDSTFLIIGQARAGTSMVSNLLNELGVYMGKKIGPVYEDNELGLFVNDLSNSVTPVGFLNKICERNNSHHKWGWKRPDLYSYLEVVLPNIRNPRIICCLRDVVAISTRNTIALTSSTSDQEFKSLSLLNEALEVQKLIFEKIEAFKIPSLLISYEKAFSLPESFLFSLSQFTGVALEAEKQHRLLNLIQPNHLGYSLRARNESFAKTALNFGVLKSIENGILSAFYKAKCGTNHAELWLDGVKVMGIKLEEKHKIQFKRITFDVTAYYRKENHFFELKFDDGTHFLNSPYFWCNRL